MTMDWLVDGGLIILQLIFLEGILSIDNAMVLGSLASHLPSHKKTPWPAIVPQYLAEELNIFLGNQQQAALRVGLLGAYLGRGLMLLLATYIIHNPWLRLVGGLYLIKLAVDHLGELTEKGESIEKEVKEEMKKEVIPLEKKAKKGFWSTVIVIELSDLIFSLDNVVAAVAISDKFIYVFTGVAIGIFLMRLAAGVFIHLIEKEPILAEAAYLLILNIGLELLIEDFFHMEIGDLTKFAISILTLILCLIYSHSPRIPLLEKILFTIGLGFNNLRKLWQLEAYQKLLNASYNILKRD